MDVIGVRRVGMLLSIPLILGLSPVVGGAIGWAMDRLFGTRPFFTILILLAGFAAGVRETWLLIQKATREDSVVRPPSAAATKENGRSEKPSG